jgi:hypothetical protein
MDKNSKRKLNEGKSGSVDYCEVVNEIRQEIESYLEMICTTL